MTFCSNCNLELNFCPNCGQGLRAKQNKNYVFTEAELREGCKRSVENVKGLLNSASLLVKNRDSQQYALGLYVQVFKAPGGPGPYGITRTPDGSIYYASLAGNHIARINLKSHNSTVILPPTPDQGARRIWSDSHGRLWVTEWNAGNLAMYNPATNQWKEWSSW